MSVHFRIRLPVLAGGLLFAVTASADSPLRYQAPVGCPGEQEFVLAAEVRAIDAARTAISWESADQALRRVAGYRRAFPQGVLRADAEVVGLEALAAKGDRAALERQAALFFARHPNDPQTALVRRLLRK